MIDEPIMTHHNHPKFIRVHSYRFYGFGQMYNDIHASLKYHTEYFLLPEKFPVFHVVIYTPNPLQPQILLLSL